MIKVRFGITTLPKVNEPRGTPYWPPTLKIKQVYTIYPSSKLYILESRKIYTEISDQLFGAK